MEKHEGYCHICGRYTNLTYEHVPPRAALNHIPVKTFSGVDIIMQQQKKIVPDTDGLRYQNQQQGSGVYSLCRECNNNMGSHYASHYNDIINALFKLLMTEYNDYKNQDIQVEYLYPKLQLKGLGLPYNNGARFMPGMIF